MANNSKIDASIQNKITRYLHTGMEIPKYFPGCWDSHKYFELDKLSVIDTVLQEEPNNTEVIDIIVKVYNQKMITRYDTIAFALAKCILKGGSAVKEAGYKAVQEVCKTTEQLLTFAKYTRKLQTGNGQGWCKSIRNWYMDKDPKTLASEIVRVKSRNGRSHHTLIRKSHLKINETDVARDAVVKYVIFGLKKSKELYGENPEAKPILDHIELVEKLRHCEDPKAAAVIIKDNKLTLDHVPGHLLTAREVWNAIIPQFSINEILIHLQRIHNMGFLNTGSITTSLIVTTLASKSNVKRCDVTPLAVFITMANYEKRTRPMKHEKAKVAAEKEVRRRTRQQFDPKTQRWEWTAVRRHPRENKHWGIDQPPSQEIQIALKTLLDKSWLWSPPTGLRYMVTLDMRRHMFMGRHFCKDAPGVPAKKMKKSPAVVPTPPRQTANQANAGGDTTTPTSTAADKVNKKRLKAECFYNKHVTPGDIGILIVLQLAKREKDVKVAVFCEDGVEIVQLANNKNFSAKMAEAEIKLRNAKVGRVYLDSPIEWAMKKNRQVDVFINIVDRVTRYMELDVTGRAGRGCAGRYGPPPKQNINLKDRCPVRALERYRIHKNLPNTKLITMSLGSHKIEMTDGSHEGVLDIVGIDEHVPMVMDAFAKGHFK